MGKKNKKVLSQKNTSYQVISVDINYDKLADALIKAHEQEKKEEIKQEPKKDENIGAIKAIKIILKGKTNTKDRMTVGLMADRKSVV